MRRWSAFRKLRRLRMAASGQHRMSRSQTQIPPDRTHWLRACTDSAACPSGQVCAYPIGGGCSIAGTCMSASAIAPLCMSLPPPACGCAGQAVTVSCGAEYATAPTVSAQSCPADGGAPPPDASGSPCSQSGSNPCPSGFVCAYPLGGGCGLTNGICLAPAALLGDCNSLGPLVCGCDGETFRAECGARYADAPTSSVEACPDGGTTSSDAGDAGQPCSETSQCSSGDVCAFPLCGGCGACGACGVPGVCLPSQSLQLTGDCNMVPAQVMACNGQTVSLPCGATYVTTPVEPIPALGCH